MKTITVFFLVIATSSIPCIEEPVSQKVPNEACVNIKPIKRK